MSWLLSWAFVQSREEGRIVASQLLEKAFLHPVGPELEKSIKRTASRLAFGDGSSSLYRFVRIDAYFLFYFNSLN